MNTVERIKHEIKVAYFQKLNYDYNSINEVMFNKVSEEIGSKKGLINLHENTYYHALFPIESEYERKDDFSRQSVVIINYSNTLPFFISYGEWHLSYKNVRPNPIKDPESRPEFPILKMIHFFKIFYPKYKRIPLLILKESIKIEEKVYNIGELLFGEEGYKHYDRITSRFVKSEFLDWGIDL